MTGIKFNKPKRNKTWSRKWHNLRLACWNCWSLSNERYAYCKSLGYDVLSLTELHNKQNNPNFSSECWVPSAQGEVDGQGKYLDPAAGVTIMLSKRMRNHIDKTGHVGTRIAWVRIRGPICLLFFVAVYIPHKYRSSPTATETLAQLDALIRTVSCVKKWLPNHLWRFQLPTKTQRAGPHRKVVHDGKTRTARTRSGTFGLHAQVRAICRRHEV